MKIYIYDNAITQTNPARLEHRGTVGGRRGDIIGLSYASRRRMLRHLITMEPVDSEKVIALTLTTRPIDIDEWRRRWYLWRKELTKKKVPLFWRVELHRSGHPHVHAIAYSDRAADIAEDLWRRYYDDDCGERGILRRDASSASAWIAYICLHHAKISAIALVGLGIYLLPWAIRKIRTAIGR